MVDQPETDREVPAQRADPGELISALSALALLVLMFAAKWYGTDQLPGSATGVQRATAENAWNGLTLVRWLMLLTILVSLGSLALHFSQRNHGTTTDTAGLIAGLGTLTAILLIYRVLIDLPSANVVVDQKLGAILGMLSAIGLALGGHASMRARRLGSRAEHRSTPSESGVAAPS